MQEHNDLEPHDLQSRVERMERQLHTLRTALWVLAIVIAAIIIPPFRAFLGFSMTILLIVLGVLLFIQLIIWVLERIHQRT